MTRLKRCAASAALSVLTIMTAVFIFSNSLTPGEQSNERSASVTTAVRPVVDPQAKIDFDDLHAAVRKSAHVIEFVLLGAEIAALTALISGRTILGSRIFIPLFFSLSAAVTDELLQLTVSRSSMVKDIVIDSAGSSAGIVLYLAAALIAALLRNRKGKT
jgi:VanZ family protein